MDERIDELLEQWETADPRPTPEELCRDCSELLDEVRQQIQKLARMDAMIAGELPLAAAAEAIPRLPGYRILRRLKEGGMGTVWDAIQESTQRKVAIKVMHRSALGSPKARARFIREVRIAAALNHPHIAKVYDSGVHDGSYHYVMEYIPGLHLDEYVRRHACEQTQILRIFSAVCGAVQHAHGQGVVHRDLKPSNILITPDGQPHVLDFGLARLLEDHGGPSISISNEVLGTPAYMSPEQAAGSHDAVTPRSDVYSLGIILYRLLLGESPHSLTGTHFQVMRRIAEQEVRLPRSVQQGFDRVLEAIILKCLLRSPHERYGDAGALRLDVERYLAGDPIQARGPSSLYLLVRRMKAHARVAYVAAAVVAVAALVTLAVWPTDSGLATRTVAVVVAALGALALWRHGRNETVRLAQEAERVRIELQATEKQKESLELATADQVPAIPSTVGKPWEPAWGYVPGSPDAWGAFFREFKRKYAGKQLDVLILGDAMLEPWQDDAAGVWSAFTANRRIANHSISANTTREVLWELEHGLLESTDTRLVVLNVGMMSLMRGDECRPEDVVRGIQALVEAVARKSPTSKVLLLGLLPAWKNVVGGTSTINHQMTGWAKERSIPMVDVSPLVTKGERVLHPDFSRGGSERERFFSMIADAISPYIQDAPAAKGTRADSLISNGDMEAGDAIPTGWDFVDTWSGTLRGVRDTTTFARGGASLRVEAVGGPAHGFVGRKLTNLKLNIPYVLSALVKSENTAPPDATGFRMLFFIPMLTFHRGGGLNELEYIPDPSGWTLIRIRFYVPPQTKWTLIGVNYNGLGPYWFGAVDLREEKFPTILPSGDMERGDRLPEGWSQYLPQVGTITMARDTQMVFSGKASLRLEAKDHSEGGAQAELPFLDGSASFILTGQLRTAGSCHARLGVAFWDCWGAYLGTEWAAAAAGGKDGWDQQRLEFVLPCAAAAAKVRVAIEGDGTLWCDDVEVHQGIPTPTELVHDLGENVKPWEEGSAVKTWRNDWYNWFCTDVAIFCSSKPREVVIFGNGWLGGLPNAAAEIAFGKRRTFNFARGYHTTREILWMIRHGALDRVRPRLVIIGPECCPGYAPEENARGIQAVVEELQTRLPRTNVLLAPPPFGPQWQACDGLYAALATAPHIEYVPFPGALLKADGSLADPFLANDSWVHLNDEGYARWAMALQPAIQRLLTLPNTRPVTLDVRFVPPPN